jgi:hypothetical protein
VEIAKQTASDRGFSSRPGAEPARQRLIAVRPPPQDTLMLRFASEERAIRAFLDRRAVVFPRPRGPLGRANPHTPAKRVGVRPRDDRAGSSSAHPLSTQDLIQCRYYGAAVVTPVSGSSGAQTVARNPPFQSGVRPKIGVGAGKMESRWRTAGDLRQRVGRGRRHRSLWP